MNTKKIYHKSSFIYKHEGIWVLNIKADSYYETGYAHGKLLKLSKHPLYKLFKNKLIVLVIKSLALIFKKSLKRLYVEKKYIDELRGIADASEISYKVIFFINFIYDVFRKSIFCSSFNFFSPTTIIARNTDSLKWIASLALKYEVTVIHRVCIKNSVPFTHVGLGFFIGVINGYNKSGICVNNHLVLGAKNGRIKSPISPNVLLLRKVIEEAYNLDMAEKILTNSSLSYATTALITDSKNKNSFVFEATSEKCFFVKTQNSYQACTMHFISETMKPLSRVTNTGSEKRLSFLNLVLSQKSVLDEDEVISILKNTENGLKRNKGGYSMTNSGTFQSFVFYPLEDLIITSNGKKLPVSLSGNYIRIRF